MISRYASNRWRPALADRPRVGQLALLGALLGVAATLLVATAAGAAPSPSAKSGVRSVTVTGPANKQPLTFRQDRQPDEYQALLSEVSWMDESNPDIFSSTPTDLGAHYVVTVFVGSKVVARYDLYPDVNGGPRAHRQQVGSTPSAWFFAPVDMSATLAAIGVKLPSSVSTNGILTHHPKVTPLMTSITGIFRQSITALALAGLGCLAILVLLGAAARHSRAADRRRTLPPAIARLNNARAEAASGPGARIRPAVPAARLAALRRGRWMSPTAPVGPPGAAPAIAPLAVTRPRRPSGASAIADTRTKGARKPWLNWLPPTLKSIPARLLAPKTEPISVGAGGRMESTVLAAPTGSTPMPTPVPAPTTQSKPTVANPSSPPVILALSGSAKTSTDPETTPAHAESSATTNVVATVDTESRPVPTQRPGEPAATAGPDKPGGPGNMFEPTQRLDRQDAAATAPSMFEPTQRLDRQDATATAPSMFEPTQRIPEPATPVVIPDKPGGPGSMFDPWPRPGEHTSDDSPSVSRPTEAIHADTPSVAERADAIEAEPTPLNDPTETVDTGPIPVSGPAEAVHDSADKPDQQPDVDEPTTSLDGPTEVVDTAAAEPPAEHDSKSSGSRPTEAGEADG